LTRRSPSTRLLSISNAHVEERNHLALVLSPVALQPPLDAAKAGAEFRVLRML
jgi:hypothetical protein